MWSMRILLHLRSCEESLCDTARVCQASPNKPAISILTLTGDVCPEVEALPQGLAKSHPMLKLSEPRIGPNRIELRFALQPADQSGSILKRSRRTPGRYRQELCRCRRSISGNVYLCSFAQIINYFFRSGAVPSESL